MEHDDGTMSNDMPRKWLLNLFKITKEVNNLLLLVQQQSHPWYSSSNKQIFHVPENHLKLRFRKLTGVTRITKDSVIW